MLPKSGAPEKLKQQYQKEMERRMAEVRAASKEEVLRQLAEQKERLETEAED